MNSPQLAQLVKEAQTRWNATPLPQSAPLSTLSNAELAQRIDHTLLKADAVDADFQKLCAEARSHGFMSVCVNSSRVGLARSLLEGATSIPIAVVGFPLGACTTRTKVFETGEAIENGAREIDMVLMIGSLKDGDFMRVYDDIRAVVLAGQGLAVKVILETALLTRNEKIAACVIAREAGAQFVKTSTGFSTAGATVEDIQLMRAVVGTQMKVKASGGIRTREDALKMIQAGADRIGASASVAMVTGSPAAQEGY